MVLILKFYHLGFIYIFHKQNAHSFAKGTEIRIFKALCGLQECRPLKSFE